MIKGIIFDMDGVVSDTQRLHAQVDAELFRGLGVNINPDEITRRYAGMRTRDVFAEILKDHGLNHDLGSLIDLKWSIIERMALETVEPVKGSIDLIKRLFVEGYPLAVVSGSNFRYMRIVLERLDVFQYFSCVIGGDMVIEGKPDPEGFFLAASKIGVRPEACLVIEDGINGMIAAKRAGMFCIGLVKDKEKEYPIDDLVTSLSEITLDRLKGMIR